MDLLFSYAGGVLTGVLATVLACVIVAKVLAPARARSLVVQQAAEDIAAVKEGEGEGEG